MNLRLFPFLRFSNSSCLFPPQTERGSDLSVLTVLSVHDCFVPPPPPSPLSPLWSIWHSDPEGRTRIPTKAKGGKGKKNLHLTGSRCFYPPLSFFLQIPDMFRALQCFSSSGIKRKINVSSCHLLVKMEDKDSVVALLKHFSYK